MSSVNLEDSGDINWSDAQGYRRSLNSIEEIRSIAGHIPLELPQIVVIGDQSSGKSSLLSALSTIQFPQGVGICTRCPLVVRLIKSERSYFKVGGVACGRNRMTEKIKEAHRRRFPAFSENPITVDISASDQIDLTLVDLPGIFHQGNTNDIEMVKKMICRYIASPSAIILVVTEANVDEELQEAISMVRNHDQTERRTLRVLTKCDVFSEEARKKDARDLITREMEREHGAHAVCCRINGEKTASRDEMALLVNTFGARCKDRLGVENLKHRLIELLEQCIRVNYTRIRQKVTEKEREANNTILRLGESGPEPSQIMSHLSATLKNETKNLKGRLTRHLEVFKQKIMESKDFVNEMKTRECIQYDCFSPAIFQGREAFDEFVHEIAYKCWKPICETTAETILKEMEHLKYEGNYEKRLEDRLAEKWQKKWLEIQAKLFDFTKELIKKVSKFGTMNSYLAAGQEELVIGTKFVEDAFGSLDRRVFGSTRKAERQNGTFFNYREYVDEEDIIKHVKQHFANKVAEQMQRFNRSSVNEQQIKRVHAYVLANWSIEHNTVTDELHKFVGENIVAEYEKWAMQIQASPDLCNCAREPESVQRERQEALDQREKMRECHERILDLENLS